MHSYIQTTAGHPVQALAWCDAPDAVLALSRPPTDVGGVATLYRWRKGSVPGVQESWPVRVGRADPGAGNIYYPLAFPGRQLTDQNNRDYLHISNVENAHDPEYRMTRVGEMMLNGQRHSCRYVPQAAFMGATDRRTVIIWDNGRTATYATRNFDGSPGVYVTGGQRSQTSAGVNIYRFPAPGGYVYNVSTGGEDAKVTVIQRGVTRLSEPFRAYSQGD
ncbi:hypothetical protein [Deinococcus sp. Marseille-Q6407]|uniref:hypothetical protein n=1 Tax=Deinococcus sp. Marseille-Q6407 TaxID=2969223 RepID=UPI0021BE7060|nr:hypothetical protein [Deinococcus sp. Marseille-Q6407]